MKINLLELNDYDLSLSLKKKPQQQQQKHTPVFEVAYTNKLTNRNNEFTQQNATDCHNIY